MDDKQKDAFALKSAKDNRDVADGRATNHKVIEFKFLCCAFGQMGY